MRCVTSSRLRRFFAVVLVLALVLGLSAPAFAYESVAFPPPESGIISRKVWDLMTYAEKVQVVRDCAYQRALTHEYVATAHANGATLAEVEWYSKGNTTAYTNSQLGSKTVGQVSSVFGGSTDDVITAVVNKAAEAKSTGAVGAGAGSGLSAGSVVGGLVVSSALAFGAEWLIDKALGRSAMLHADGSACPFQGVGLSFACTGEHYTYMSDGWLGDEIVPGELAYLFPGYDFVSADALPTYSFTEYHPYAGVDPTDPSIGWPGGSMFRYPPIPHANDAYWGSEAVVLSRQVVSLWGQDSPIRPMHGFSVPPYPLTHFSGYFNRVTGEQSPAYGTTLMYRYPGDAGGPFVTAADTSTATDAPVIVQWYEDQMAAMLADGSVVEEDANEETVTVAPGVPIGAVFPPGGAPVQVDLPEGGFDADSTLDEITDSVTLPEPVDVPEPVSVGLDIPVVSSSWVADLFAPVVGFFKELVFWPFVFMAGSG